METRDFKTRTIFNNRPAPYRKGEWVIGLDIGYSSVKGFSPNKVYCFPAFAKKIEDLSSFIKAHGDSDIRYRDEQLGTWVVGELAYNETTSEEDMSSEDETVVRNRYKSPVYKIITRVGLALGLMANEYNSPHSDNGPDKLIVQAGLPPAFLKRGDSKAVCSVIKGHHKFELMIGKNTQWKQFEFIIDEDNVYFIEQPKGALISASVDERGKQTKMCPIFFNSELIVFDPGFGTLDDYVAHLGRVVLSNTYPDLSMYSVFRATCDDIRKKYGKDITVPQLQTYLEKGMIYVIEEDNEDSLVSSRKMISFADILEENCRKICKQAIEKMSEKHNKFENTEYIIATGGTYDAWADYIQDTFKNVEGLTVVPANINDTTLSNIFSNVRGYYFYRMNSKN